jgi:hypothetical protein
MPKYTIQVPDGRKVTAEAPDEATAMKGIQEWYAQNSKTEAPAAPELSAGETALDTAISAGSGVTKGALDLATAPASLATAGAGAARGLGASEETIDYVKDVVSNAPILGRLLKGSQNLRDARESGSLGAISDYENYQPESNPGKYAKSIGQFAPGAIGGGAGMATRLAKYAVLPGVASERLGQMYEGGPMEGIARGVGGLAGLGVGGALNRFGERAARNRLATADHFEQAGHDAYEAAKTARVHIRNPVLQNLQTGLSQHLDNIGFLPGSETKANAALNQIYRDLNSNNSRVLAGRGAQTGFGQRPIALWELDKVGSKIMQKIKDLRPDDNGDRRILWAAKHYVDDFAQRLTPNDVMSGNVDEGLAALRAAKDNWRTKSKLELLDQMEESAEHTGRAVYTRAGVEHANRAEAIKYLRQNPNKRQRLTEDEIAAMERIADGTIVSNAARDFGKLSNSTQTSLFNAGLAGSAGFYLGGPLGLAIGLGLPTASRASRAYANAATRRAVNDARSIVINGRRMPRPYKSILGKLNTATQSLNNEN